MHLCVATIESLDTLLWKGKGHLLILLYLVGDGNFKVYTETHIMMTAKL